MLKFLLFICILIAISINSAFANVRADALVKAAFERTLVPVTYNGAYYSIAYPGGDVPDNIGVCTDLVIRSYRSLGIDLQRRVHEDMRGSFDQYPSKQIWGLHNPDKNIDHRRVPNLQAFFTRHGMVITSNRDKSAFLAGDIVSWMLPGNLPHIGIVSDAKAEDGTPLIIHNIGSGPKQENVLFSYQITGHYRYFPQT